MNTMTGGMVTTMMGGMTMIGGMVTMTAITRIIQLPSVMVARRFRYSHISKLELMIIFIIQIPSVMMKSVWQSKMKVTSTHAAFKGRPPQRF